MLPDMVERRDLLAAVSLSSAQFNLGRVIGPALAGLVTVAAGYAATFAANTVSFGAVVVALLLIRLPAHQRTADGAGLRQRMGEGVRVARSEPGCRSAIGLIAVVALLASPFIALVPAMAIVGLHASSARAGVAATSVLVTCQGVGAVAGVLVLPGLARRYGRRAQVTGALLTLPLLLVLYGLAPRLVVAGAALLLVGAAYIGVLSGLNTVVQLRAPEAARARVLSLYMFALGTVYPLGAVLQGWAGHASSVRAVTVVSAVALAAVLGTLALARPQVFRALGDRPAVADAPVAPS
jgi:predicted MFS family arabinose efflux permease